MLNIIRQFQIVDNHSKRVYNIPVMFQRGG